MSSNDAKQATGAELDGIIRFFQVQLQKQQAELIKYQQYRDQYHLPFAQLAMDHVTQHIMQTEAALRDYQALKKNYEDQNRSS